MSSSSVNDLDSFLFSSQAASTSSSLFNQIFSANDPSVNPILANIEPCSYHNQPSSIHSYKTNDLLIVRINIRSILKNFDNLSHFFSQFSTSSDIICLTETRLNKNPLIYINIPGYQFVYGSMPTQLAWLVV